MPETDKTIYKTCRDEAGLTQEEAAEKLNCSVRQLARYEAGEQQTPEDIANRMVIIYDSPLLKVQHLRLVSPIAADLLPPVIERGLGEVAMRITNRMRRFYQGEQGYRLLEIAQWLHMDSRTVKATFPMKGGGARGASCWISVASLARAMS